MNLASKLILITLTAFLFTRSVCLAETHTFDLESAEPVNQGNTPTAASTLAAALANISSDGARAVLEEEIGKLRELAKAASGEKKKDLEQRASDIEQRINQALDAQRSLNLIDGKGLVKEVGPKESAPKKPGN